MHSERNAKESIQQTGKMIPDDQGNRKEWEKNMDICGWVSIKDCQKLTHINQGFYPAPGFANNFKNTGS